MTYTSHLRSPLVNDGRVESSCLFPRMDSSALQDIFRLAMNEVSFAGLDTRKGARP